jgi:hypothetical protein
VGGTVRIKLGRIACSGIEAHAGGDIEAAAKAALLHYTHALKSSRPPIGLPRLCPNQEGTQNVHVLTLDSECEGLLAREAARQKTSVSQIVVHALLIYLAELDSLAAPRTGTSGA